MIETTEHVSHRSPAPLVRLLAVVLGLLLVTWLVVAQSRSAFTDTTDNDGNVLETGSIELTDNDNGAALFNVTKMTGGQSATECIQVTYTGSLDAAEPIRLGGGYADGNGNGTEESSLAPYLDLSIQMGAAGSTCQSFTAPTTISTGSTFAAFRSAHNTWGNGASTGWTPTGGAAQMRPFRITLTVKDDNAAQGQIAEPAFTWEVHSS